MKRSLLSMLFVGAITVMTTCAQTPDTLRICTYNVMNIGGLEVPRRIPAIQWIINREIHPDVFVYQDIDMDRDGFKFLDAMSAFGQFRYGTSFNGPGTDRGFNISRPNDDRLRYYWYVRHDTPFRSVDEVVLSIGKTNPAEPADTLHVFICHLKEGNTRQDSLDRIAEATVIRRALDAIPMSHHRIVAGDLNVYSSSEEAYQILTRVGIVVAGEVMDPIHRPGEWHDNPEFADLHTASTRLRQFDSGAGGGLANRFDFILLSPSLMPHYIPGSYTTFGNDGQHFRDSINAKPNIAAGRGNAERLHDASDHLPVYLDLVFPGITSDVKEDSVRRSQEMDLSMKPE